MAFTAEEQAIIDKYLPSQGGGPTGQTAHSVSGDYTIPMQDVLAAIGYYNAPDAPRGSAAFGGDYNPAGTSIPKRLPGENFPGARFGTAKYSSPDTKPDAFTGDEWADIHDSGLQDRLRQIREEFSRDPVVGLRTISPSSPSPSTLGGFPVQSQRRPADLPISRGAYADQRPGEPIRNQIPVTLPMYGSQTPVERLSPAQIQAMAPDEESGLALNLPARGPRKPTEYPGGQMVGQSPMSIRLELFRKLLTEMGKYDPSGLGLM